MIITVTTLVSQSVANILKAFQVCSIIGEKFVKRMWIRLCSLHNLLFTTTTNSVLTFEIISHDTTEFNVWRYRLHL